MDGPIDCLYIAPELLRDLALTDFDRSPLIDTTCHSRINTPSPRRQLVIVQNRVRRASVPFHIGLPDCFASLLTVLLCPLNSDLINWSSSQFTGSLRYSSMP